MMEGLDETELEAYLDENPRIITLFEIDVLKASTPQQVHSKKRNTNLIPSLCWS